MLLEKRVHGKIVVEQRTKLGYFNLLETMAKVSGIQENRKN